MPCNVLLRSAVWTPTNRLSSYLKPNASGFCGFRNLVSEDSGTCRCVGANRNRAFRGSRVILTVKVAMSWTCLSVKTRTPRNVGMPLHTDAASCPRKINLAVQTKFSWTSALCKSKFCAAHDESCCNSKISCSDLSEFWLIWIFDLDFDADLNLHFSSPIESPDIFQNPLKTPFSSTSSSWSSLLSRIMVKNLQFVSKVFKILVRFPHLFHDTEFGVEFIEETSEINKVNCSVYCSVYCSV